MLASLSSEAEQGETWGEAGVRYLQGGREGGHKVREGVDTPGAVLTTGLNYILSNV
jgi:hypothetical protein